MTIIGLMLLCNIPFSLSVTRCIEAAAFDLTFVNNVYEYVQLKIKYGYMDHITHTYIHTYCVVHVS